MVENLLGPERQRPRYWLFTVMFVSGAAVGAGAVYLWLNRGIGGRAEEVRDAKPPIGGPVPLAEGSTGLLAGMRGSSAMTHAPGELTGYRIDATIVGRGREIGELLDVTLQFGGDYNVYTSSVNPDGTAELRVVFENATLAGTFLGEPYEFQFTGPNGAAGALSRDAPSAGIPPEQTAATAFLATPVTMKVAPTGEVLEVDGPRGFAEMLVYTPALAQVEYPDGERALGRQWTSHLRLPMPGVAEPLDTKVVNTFMGSGTLAGKTCGVIQQEMVSRQEGGTAQAPDQNGAMERSVPIFDVSGRNTIYFDVATGKLAHAVIDLDFHLRIDEATGDFGKIIESFGRELIEGRFKGLEDAIPAPEEPRRELLELTVSVDGAITQTGAPPPPQ